MFSSEMVKTEVGSGLLKLTFNRPDKLNSLNREMHLALRAGIQLAHNDNAIRAVFLTGQGRGFCAGQDLDDRDPRGGSPAHDLGQTLETYYNPTLRLLRTLEKPVVCAVNGVTAGAGISLALASDIVLAAHSAKFIMSFAKLGLVPDAGLSWHLTRILGEQRAKALALTGETLSANQAADWGLIWRVVDDELLQGEAQSLAHHLAKGPTRGLGMTKRLIQMAATADFDTQLDHEQHYQQQAGRTADYAEGVTAFLEKRNPVFHGE